MIRGTARLRPPSPPFAFESTAGDVLISNITVEKYASVAQKGAIHATEGTGWTIENCEVRWNSGAGIGIGTGGRVRDCDIHHNGQIGIAGHGRDISIESNRIWSNNIYGFDYTWEAGGVKIALSDGVTFRGNHVHDNNGPGLWCDIDCRNVVYDGNLVENNQDIGIFHEISFKAVIRNNVVRHNGRGYRGGFWRAEIGVAASQDVEVNEQHVDRRRRRMWHRADRSGPTDQGRRQIQDAQQHSSRQRFNFRGRRLRRRRFRRQFSMMRISRSSRTATTVSTAMCIGFRGRAGRPASSGAIT